ncbi:oligoribonuclease [Propionicicella superfundia]|uniref:oligoribonuclease n=1 Tax=Propionicicella superfundia TaxID=348582 RepID=UPI0006871DF8|nr:oligoribonuclease [Propionicicella superfundia]
MKDLLVWIDCEMTGLNIDTDELCEIGALVTDGDLNVLGEGVDVIIRPSAAAVAQMDDFVTNMHAQSGLSDAWEFGVDVGAAEAQVLEYVRAYVPEARKAPLAGNTIGTDRAFLAKYMPALEGHVHYRNVDVSSVKELARRWFPRVYFNAPAKNGGHRALADIAESIEELRYYREALFRSEPGLTTDELKEISSRHEASLTAGLAIPAAPQPDESASSANGEDASATPGAGTSAAG